MTVTAEMFNAGLAVYGEGPTDENNPPHNLIGAYEAMKALDPEWQSLLKRFGDLRRDCDNFEKTMAVIASIPEEQSK